MGGCASPTDGGWPLRESGAVQNALGETWSAANAALQAGIRGLPGGSSLAQLLAQRRGVRNVGALPKLSNTQILKWADAHRQRTRCWPTSTSGEIPNAAGETWAGVNDALRSGLRGFPGGSSLFKLLAEKRGMPWHKRRPPFTLTLILEWADAHHERTAHWPNQCSGPIPEAPGESWKKVTNALQYGQRGLRGGQSLGKLLTKRRRVKDFRRRLQLNIDQILNWADIHCERTGNWPTRLSGPVHEAPHVTWHRINQSLRHGTCGLPGGSALAELLVEQRGVRNKKRLPPYHIKQILSWADRHHKQTGEWPNQVLGPIAAAPGETWKAVNSALITGGRGLPTGSTLARLLAEWRAVRNKRNPPKYTLKQILEWAQSQHARTGSWPIATSGAIQDAHGETWQAVDMALRKGRRGLKAGSSLSRLLKQKGMVSRRVRTPVL